MLPCVQILDEMLHRFRGNADDALNRCSLVITPFDFRFECPTYLGETSHFAYVKCRQRGCLIARRSSLGFLAADVRAIG
jgi:hypothetical protein